MGGSIYTIKVKNKLTSKDKNTSSIFKMKAPRMKSRIIIAICILLIIALIHIFRVGSTLQGSLYTLYYGYFSDIIIPFGMFFLLYFNEIHIPLLRKWQAKAILVFGIASSTEIMQACGVPLLGQTFDPLDFVMFGTGVLLAVAVDQCLINRFLPR